MSFQASHDVTCSRARHGEVLKTIHAWLSEHQFRTLDAGSNLLIRAEKGSHWGLSDSTRIRIMEVLVRPEFGLTVVSVYHSTPRIGFIVGTMNSDILSRETESLINAINSIPYPGMDDQKK